MGNFENHGGGIGGATGENSKIFARSSAPGAGGLAGGCMGVERAFAAGFCRGASLASGIGGASGRMGTSGKRFRRKARDGGICAGFYITDCFAVSGSGVFAAHDVACFKPWTEEEFYRFSK